MERALAALVEVLRGYDPDAGVIDAADWVWLAALVENGRGGESEATAESRTREEGNATLDAGRPGTEPTRRREIEQPSRPERGQDDEQRDKDRPDHADISPAGSGMAAGTGTGDAALPWLSPGGRALPQPLALARALRPLVRRVPAPDLPPRLDEEGTIRRVLDSNDWLPVFRPRTRPWLDLALVVDVSSSMRIWQATARELRTVLTQLGAFRDLRPWRLDADPGDGSPRLRASVGRATRRHRELLNPARTCLILLVSDCVAAFWRDPRMIEWLADWGRAHPVGLMQVLPDQRLWARGALGGASRWAVSALIGATPNARLRRRALSAFEPGPHAVQSAVPLPMTTLAPDGLRAWAGLVAATNPAERVAFVLQPPEPEAAGAARTQAGWEARYAEFRVNATPTARRLASLLAAAPLRLPVIRLVQAALLPQSNQTHLAEFFLSGLIRRDWPQGNRDPGLQPQVDEDPDRIDYDFLAPELRQRLLSDGPIDDSIEVQICVGEYLARHRGGPNPFLAAIHTGGAEGLGAVTAAGEPYARVTRAVLEWLGIRPEAAGTDQHGVGLGRDSGNRGDSSLSPSRIDSEFETRWRRLLDPLQPLPPGLRQLVGRRGLRQRLGKALESDEVAVIAIRAAGGTGKSVLVREWLGGLNANIRAKTRAFAWQFADSSDPYAGSSNDLLTKITSPRDGSGSGEPRESRFLSEDRKAKLLLDWYRETPTILVLDNLEALQGQFPERLDQLIDEPIKQFLTELAGAETGSASRLVVLTTRQPLPELDGFSAYRFEELPPFTPEEGVQLLRVLGITGTDRQLGEASRDYGGNALALVLLASLILADPHSNDINYREEIRLFEAEHREEIAGLAHAERVLFYYERNVNNPEEVMLLRMMGLFHRPMTAAERVVLLEKADFTAGARGPTVIDWKAVHSKLEQVGLLTRVEGDRVEWDCHPLVRERFREDFRKNAPEHWCQAHRVLFDYFPGQARDPARTREELVPLYRSIHHGCLAGAFAEALQVYMDRIMRGPVIAHGANELGAISEDSAALRMFFWPNSTELLPGAREQIDIQGQAWLQARTAFCLTSLGRLSEAIHHRRAELEYCRLQDQDPHVSKQQRHELRKNTANAAGEISALLLLVGDIAGAREAAGRALRHADESGDWGQRVHARCRLGAALHMQGDLSGARVLFEEAVAIRGAIDIRRPTLHSEHGYLYRRLLLDGSDGADYGYFKSILFQAEAALDADQRDSPNIWLVAIGLDLLSRAAALSRMSERGELERDILGATSNFHKAEDTLSDSGTVIYFSELNIEWARFSHSRGLAGEAERRLNRAAIDARGYGMPLCLADADLLWAEILIGRPDDEDAARQARAALETVEQIVEAHDYRRILARVQALRARIGPGEQRADPAVTPPPYREYLQWLIDDWTRRTLASIDPAPDKLGAQISVAEVYLDPPVVEVDGGTDGRHAGTPMLPRRDVLLLDDPQARCNLLLGPPGSGKSTLVAKRAAEHARQLTEASATWRDPDTAAAHWPLRLLLHEHVEQIPSESGDESAELVWRLVESELARRLPQADAHELMGRLRPELTRRGWFYFDGFDEVPESDGRRRALGRSLARFAEALGPQAHILVTGRPHALLDGDGPGWAGFRLLTIEPLDPERVEQLVDRVHRRIARALGWDDEVRERRASNLKVALRERGDLMELASRPLMLTLILALHLRRVRLPEDRAEVYEQVIDLLLSRWQHQPGGDRLVPEPLRPVLFGEPGIVRDRIQALAWHIHVRHQGSADQNRAGAGDAVSDREVLALLAESLPDNVSPMSLLVFLDQRTGLLVRGAGGHFDFPQRSCREYLAACYLIDSEPEPGERLVTLVREDPGWWREVFLLAVGKVRLGGLANALEIVTRLLPADGTPPEQLDETQWRDLALAARALVELRVGERNPHHPFTRDTLRRVVDWAQHLLSGGHLAAAERAKAGEYLGALGDPRPGVGLDPQGLPRIDWIGPLSGQLPVPDGTGWWPLPVAAFAIARFPVTVAQYGAFVAAGGYEEPSLWQVEGWDWRQAMGHQASPYAWREQQAHPNRPVVGVSWYEAMAFCRWLSLAMDEPIRLPTERQWQFAAGGEERRPFPWGKAAGNPDTRANTSGSGIGAPAPVGIYPAGASPEGVMDLAGNVCEWCCDSFEDPPRFELEDCDGQSHAELRVARGGGWWSSPAEASSNGREGFRPGLCDRDIGLRLVRHAVAG